MAKMLLDELLSVMLRKLTIDGFPPVIQIHSHVFEQKEDVVYEKTSYSIRYNGLSPIQVEACYRLLMDRYCQEDLTIGHVSFKNFGNHTTANILSKIWDKSILNCIPVEWDQENIIEFVKEAFFSALPHAKRHLLG